jgi:hypothetical protein
MEITDTVPQLFLPPDLAPPPSNGDDDELEDMEEDANEETKKGGKYVQDRLIGSIETTQK